jgi:hypothetical protein
MKRLFLKGDNNIRIANRESANFPQMRFTNFFADRPLLVSGTVVYFLCVLGWEGGVGRGGGGKKKKPYESPSKVQSLADFLHVIDDTSNYLT